jgi:HD-GYP domain-containing protein (c-di-GMP phosphodiesterase class II)
LAVKESKLGSWSRVTAARLAGRDAAWVLLDQFIHELQASDRGATQMRSALETVRAETGADVVFLYKTASGEASFYMGARDLSLEWCRQVAQRLIVTGPNEDREQVRTGLSFFADSAPPVPDSAALVRLRESRRDWIVAINFDADRPLNDSDLRVMSVVGRLVSDHTRHTEIYDRLKDTLFGLVRCLTATIDAKDPYTCGHSERVARIAVRLGQEIGLPAGDVSDLYLAGLLHDVGKIGIRDNVLSKAGDLTDEERAHIQEHPLIGDRIVSNVKQLAYLRPGVRNHHERFDGAGYPDGLAGDACPTMARLVAVADACDAMLSARRYRPAMPPSQVEQTLLDGAGSQWDPRYVEAFMSCRHDIFAVCHRGLGQSVYTAVERAARSGSDGSRRVTRS